jgi:hypothetical protein
MNYNADCKGFLKQLENVIWIGGLGSEMKISKWRLGIVLVPTSISFLEWLFGAINTYAFFEHRTIPKILLPKVPWILDVFVNPMGCTCDYSEISYQPIWVISAFCFGTVLTTFLLWGLVTWPVEFVLAKARLKSQGTAGDGRGTAIEFALLFGSLVCLTGLAFYLANLYPGK